MLTLKFHVIISTTFDAIPLCDTGLFHILNKININFQLEPL